VDFGYFTLSDNYDPHNPRTACDLVLEIREQEILAGHLGFHSAWIGEYHFDRLGMNSRPDLLLASLILDRIEQLICKTKCDEEAKDFIETRDMFFFATVNR
jgi:hypothetical protein